MTNDVPKKEAEAEIAAISEMVAEKDRLPEIIALLVNLELHELLQVRREIADKSADTLLKELISLRTVEIENRSTGLLLAPSSEPLKDNEIVLNPVLQDCCDIIARNIFKSPGLLPHGILLAGPSGTGKNIIPQYIAAKAGVPFVKMGPLDDLNGGKSGYQLDRVFATAIALKPCIVLIDNIDSYSPLTSKFEGGSLSNGGFKRTFHIKTGDDHDMRGIVLFGTTKHPEDIDSPLLASHRFGNVIAVLPPKSGSERMSVFKAVWNQIKYAGPLSISDEQLEEFLRDLPDHITGSDLKRLINDAIHGSESHNIWEALHYLKKLVMNGRYLAKPEGFDDIVNAATEKDNRSCLLDEES